jgi:sec-independent protein translocase protein TatA
MGSFGIWHWLIVILVIGVLFGGKGKIANVMGDFAKGIKAFKSGMKEEEVAHNAPPAQVTGASSAGGASTTADRAATDRT